MRKRFVFPLILLAFLLVGCGKKVDSEALQEISMGLENRWEYTNQLPNEVTVEELEKAVQLELDELEKYNAEDFKDKHLYVLYSKYRNELDLIKTLMHGKSADSPEFQKQWEDHMEKRSKTLYDLNNEYELSIKSSNKTIFEKVLTNADRLVEIEEMKDILSEIETLTDVNVEIEENAIAVIYNTESALSNNSFIGSKTGFPSKAMDILRVLKEYDYDDIVITTKNNDIIAVSAYFDKSYIDKVDFNKWEELDSIDAYKFYAMSTAYHIRTGIWEGLDAETKKLIGDMNKQNSNEFWNCFGFI